MLQDISLTVRKGEVVALVGPSGAGKTTLLELVPRFHEPTSGELRLDGVPLPRVDPPLAAAVDCGGEPGYGPAARHGARQHRLWAGQGDLTRGARGGAWRPTRSSSSTACPNGYDTVLGERGARLSGGQRQRIAIARALLRDAPILILDEATSALDTESERLVQEAIERLMRDRTVLVIAHRLATVRNADRIVVIDEGRLVEVGNARANSWRAPGSTGGSTILQFSVAEVTT